MKCGDYPNQRFLPVTDDIIRRHLSGHDDCGRPFVAGVYPMLLDESCLLLAIDFATRWRDGERNFAFGSPIVCLLLCSRVDRMIVLLARRRCTMRVSVARQRVVRFTG